MFDPPGDSIQWWRPGDAPRAADRFGCGMRLLILSFVVAMCLIIAIKGGLL